MAATTTTTTASATTPTAVPAPSFDRRPKDSMKSTWRTASKKTWNPFHWLVHIMNLYPVRINQEVPVFNKTDPVPYFDTLAGHIWILIHAAWPMAIQYVWQQYTGKAWSALSTFTLFTHAMQFNSIHQIWVIRRFAHQIGFLDGDKHARDQVPDVGVMKTVTALLGTVTFRPLIAVLFSYKRSTSLSLSWWLPVELALYGVVLDFFFYAYHRACHESEFLWKYHRTHHLTKHPNVLLSSYADQEQEFLEIMLIPLLAWATLKYVFGLPMGFHDWWVCHEYVIFSEAMGHSGLRMYSTSVTPAQPILAYFDAELALEDHDLHHRRGWKKSANYGKQTRVWDRVFGTVGERIETGDMNVDWNRPVKMPWY